jgi:MFS transporter, AAHS family, vanillate permease
LGGALAASVVQVWGWRVAFEGGALGSLLLLPIAFVFLPESASYERAAAAPSPASIPLWKSSVGPALLLRQRPGMTLLLWLAFFFAYAGYYFVFSWTPKLLVAGGLSARDGMNAGVLLSLGGLAGTLLFAFFGGKVPLRWLLLFCLVSSVLTMITFPAVAQGTSLAVATGMILGATTTSAMACFYALTPRLYAPLTRSAGMGWAVGIGRIGAIAAPFFTGVLVDSGWRTSHLFCLFGLSLALAAVASLLLTRESTAANRVNLSEHVT